MAVKFNYSTGHKYCNISTGVLVDFHMIHYTQIIWEEVAFILESNWKSCCNIYDRYCISKSKQAKSHKLGNLRQTVVLYKTGKFSLPAIGRHCTSAAVLIGYHAQRNGPIESNGEI